MPIQVRPSADIRSTAATPSSKPIDIVNTNGPRGASLQLQYPTQLNCSSRVGHTVDAELQQTPNDSPGALAMDGFLEKSYKYLAQQNCGGRIVDADFRSNTSDVENLVSKNGFLGDVHRSLRTREVFK